MNAIYNADSFFFFCTCSVYDDSLILQQIEPPIFSNGTASVGQLPEGTIVRRRSRNKSGKVGGKKCAACT